MKLSSQIKPISYLKTRAAEIVRTIGEERAPLVITQNGEAKVVLQDIESYEQTPETLALLKILSLGSRQIEAGKVEPAAVVIQRLRERRSALSRKVFTMKKQPIMLRTKQPEVFKTTFYDDRFMKKATFTFIYRCI